MKIPLRLMVSRKSVQCKDDAGSIVDFNSIAIDLAESDSHSKLEKILTRNAHSIWQYEGKRSKANTTAMLAIAIDFDEAGLTFEQTVEQFQDHICIVHVTTKHTEAKPRTRVILPLEQPITDTDRFGPICDWLKQRFPHADEKVFRVSQPLFPCAASYLDDDKNKVQSEAHANFQLNINTKGGYFAIPDDLPTTKKKSTGCTNSNTKGWESVRTEREAEFLTTRLTALFETGLSKGRRDDGAILRASEGRKLGYDRDHCAELLATWNQFNTPPLHDSDLERCINSAYSGELYDYGTISSNELQIADKEARKRIKAAKIEKALAEHPSPLPDIDPETGRIKTERERTLDSLPTSYELAGIKVFTTRELCQVDDLIQPAEEVLPWICWRETCTVISGRGGEGKSTLLRSAVIEAATEGKRVVWLTNESEPKPMRWWHRMDGISDNIFVLDLRYYYGKLENRDQKWAALSRIIEQIQPDAVVVDTLFSVLMWLDGEVPDNSEPAVWQKVVQMLGSLGTNSGGGTVLLHHMNKQNQFAGSVGIQNGCDEMFDFEKARHNPNQRSLRMRKSREGNQSFVVECDPHNYRYFLVSPDSARVKLPQKAQQLLEALRDKGPLTEGEMADLGIARRTARDYLTKWNAQKDKVTGKWSLPTAVIKDMLTYGLPKLEIHPNALSELLGKSKENKS